MIDRFAAYGFNCIRIDEGHDLSAISDALSQARAQKEKPTFIEVKTTIKNINNSNIVDFKVIQIGEYNVNKQYSQTLDNEKKLIELLTDKLADEILDQISVRLNAI